MGRAGSGDDDRRGVVSRSARAHARDSSSRSRLVAFEGLAVATILKVINDDLRDIGLLGWVFVGVLPRQPVRGRGRRLRRRPARARRGRSSSGSRSSRSGCSAPGSRRPWWCSSRPRAVQGIGAGAIGAVAYVAIGRAYPGELQPRMFAVLSTAWVLPGPHRSGHQRRGGIGVRLALGVHRPAAARRRSRP